MTVHVYQTRVRIRHAVSGLRGAGSNVDAVARDVGYKSTKNLYLRLSQMTGLTARAVRQMSDAEVEQLLGSSLALPIEGRYPAGRSRAH